MVGQILRKRREELGLDLRAISENLKIRFDYLKAIEDGNFERLPAEVYARGYIQEYAKVLNIEPGTVIDAYAHNAAAGPPGPDEGASQKTGGTRRFRTAYFLVPFLLLALIVVASLHFLSSPDKAPLPAPAVKTARGVAPEAPATSLVLQVIATETTWLLVAADQAEAKEILMRPGEAITWHAKEGFSLKIGNAGGVRVVLNGKEMGKLGARGQVIRMNLPDTSR